jgi:DNA-binding MarR family transcriptional regulator
MDAVMFEVKVAHLSLQRVGRAYTRPYGMTAARFDLMNALGRMGMVQSNLWKLLNVTRSVVCEMVQALMELRWVKRVRAADSRTWLVMLTQRGRALFQRVFDENVESGDVAVTMERGLSRGGCVDDTLPVRERLLWDCDGITEAYRTRKAWFGEPLYVCDPVDYWFALTTPEDGSFGVPLITKVDWSTWDAVPVE